MHCKASVIIPTYNRNEDLIRAISSVLKQEFKEFELIIVDQSINHDQITQRFLRNLKDKRFRYYKVTPPSLPAARNFGASKAIGEIIIFIDDDVELKPNFIKEHVAAYSKSHQIGAVAGRIRGVTEEESNQLFKISPSGKRTGSFNYPHDGEVMAVRGCNMSFRKDVLIEIGGFDSGFIKDAYREDTDASFRVRKAGYTISYKSKADLIHFDAREGGCRDDSRLFNNLTTFKNNFRFFYKNQQMKDFPKFYLRHIYNVAPNPNPIIFAKRLYYLYRGSREAKNELMQNLPLIISKETS